MTQSLWVFCFQPGFPFVAQTDWKFLSLLVSEFRDFIGVDSLHPVILNLFIGAGGMAQQVKALVLAEDLGSISSTFMTAHNHP